MKRSGFLKRIVASIAAITIAPQVLKSEPERHVFNVKKLQDRADYLRKYPLTEKEAFFPSNIIKAERIEHLDNGRHRIHYNPFEGPLVIKAGNVVMDISNERAYLVTVKNAIFLSTARAFVEITPFQRPKNRFQRACGNEFMIFQNARPEGNG